MERKSNIKVEEVMSKNLVYVHEDDFATKARALLRQYGFRSLPVVDDEKKLVGIVTRSDVLAITSTRSNIPVKGIMSTPIVFATPDEDVLEVAEKLIDANVGRAPVVKSKENMELIGIITMHDIIKVLLERDIKPKKKYVEEIMTRDVVTCDANDRVNKVLDKMRDSGYSGLPVLKNGKLVGVITRKDIIKAGYARLEREDEKGVKKKAPRVETLMSTPPITVSPKDEIKKAMEILVERNIGRLPVVEDGKLVGIVSRDDIIKAFI